MSTTQQQPSSQHLAGARRLLDELEAVTQGQTGDAQTKATAAVAHSILVLAEQVAAVRVLMVGDAVSKRSDGQSTAQDSQPAAQA